jgi:CRISPR/Cas system-associated protein Csm6
LRARLTWDSEHVSQELAQLQLALKHEALVEVSQQLARRHGRHASAELATALGKDNELVVQLSEVAVALLHLPRQLARLHADLVHDKVLPEYGFPRVAYQLRRQPRRGRCRNAAAAIYAD